MGNLDDVLDQMVEHLLRHEEIPFLDLVQFVWRSGWTLTSASDPKDDDPLRYALKACILERMVEIWNAAPRNASESFPDWCSGVPAVEKGFSVISPEYQHFWKDEIASPIFRKRNIFAPKEFMFFV